MSMFGPSYGDPGRSRVLKRIVIAAVLVVAIVLLMVFIRVLSSGIAANTRDEAAIAYVNAINVGDAATVCRLETERQRDATQAECEKEREYLSKRNVKADEPRVIATKEFAEGVGVLVEYHLTTGGEKPLHDALRMLEQPDGSWLVDETDGPSSEEMATGDPLGVTLGERRGSV